MTETELMTRLSGISEKKGLPSLAETLSLLGAYVGSDLAGVESELAEIPRFDDLVGQAGSHLLALGGKRIRPLCVALAGRVGNADPEVIRKLACAAELVHSATLLHDDVVDMGDLRRGEPTSRVIYGNAASVFAGDWLLIEGLRRVRSTGLGEVLGRLLDILDEIIAAESVQLERRGKLELDRQAYFRVIEGKTAALFRWAMYAGGRAGGLDEGACAAVEAYGNAVGIAFQIVDDALDFAGDAEETGKALFTDLREGKMTFPLIVGVERDPGLAELLRQGMAEGELSPEHGRALLGSLRESGAIDAAFAEARQHAARGVEALSALPDSEARGVLAEVARVAADRRA